MNILLSRLVNQAGEARAKELVAQESLINKLVSKSPKLRALWDDINESLEMMKKIFSGEFTDYTWKDLAWIVGGLAYLVMPIDAIPDAVPVLGLTDDAAALGIVFRRTRPLLSAYRTFLSRGLKAAGARVVQNTGAMDSCWEKLRRVNSTPLEDEPPRGTPLLVDLAYALEHSGIYLGNSEVMEVYDDESEGGRIRVVTLERFLRGDGSVRTGNQIFAACDDNGDGGCPLFSQRAADNAERFKAENSKVAYNMLRSNCHMFTAACLLGKKIFCERSGKEGFWGAKIKDSASCLAAAMVQTFSVAKLNEVISDELNAGKPVVWRPVAAWSRERRGLVV